MEPGEPWLVQAALAAFAALSISAKASTLVLNASAL
jgi:hypothetical protein